jgi:hypothetical protein
MVRNTIVAEPTDWLWRQLGDKLIASIRQTTTEDDGSLRDGKEMSVKYQGGQTFIFLGPDFSIR